MSAGRHERLALANDVVKTWTFSFVKTFEPAMNN